ncbi:hypothetical protein G5V58_00095 [Nocardioides anomalus]|uniref:SMP-30/gluconolactonase/LRE family protein n=1 Tax=Nocardioides anomalus TaxID=2712223 RepID=A0A6G6W843_9ACTN|nr:hypothetical protein [Nocardioides anomalus]QIG41379.1 hypothetical protein G5V58_00095 [Nocardioides anomalus]
MVLLLPLLLVAACTSDSSSRPSSASSASADPDPVDGCGPVAYADVRGRAPSYGAPQLDRFGNDHALCAGVWLPGLDRWLVPQGMAIADGTAYVAGFDGTQVGSRRLCTVESVSLRTGRLVAQRYPLTGQVGPREPTECRHGGGVLVDEHGVWVAETQRLWLLDPGTLAPLRVWAIDEPVRGSFAVWGRHGELGLGRFRPANPARLWWYDVDALLTSSSYEIGAGDAVRAVPVPAGAQGAVWGELGGIGPGLWVATSNASCGVLVGPDGRSRAFLPGAESMALVGDDELWVVSESGSRLYQKKGRPMTPSLARFDTSDLKAWAAPGCGL